MARIHPAAPLLLIVWRLFAQSERLVKSMKAILVFIDGVGIKLE
jgi:hypothetical protein